MGDADILLVEDNPGDVALVEQAFEERDLPGTLHPVQTGAAALDWLHGRGEFADAPRPDLVLLDLNIPAVDGQEVLAEIKATDGLTHLPVVVLTSAQSTDELAAAYERGANAVLVKPVDPAEFADALEAFADFWIATATLPGCRD